MRAKENESVLTVLTEVKYFSVHEAVLHALFYSNQLNRLILNFTLLIVRVCFHESQGQSKCFDCVKQSEMFLLCTGNSCACPIL